VEETVSDDNSEEVVHVGNVSDFLEAIKPGATIVWEPGYYNFSEYTDKVWREQGNAWNEEHTHVKLEECFDGGVEVIIQNVDNLAIMGDLESAIPTELVVETRYGEVLGFENCHQILLSGLTMGHTDEGTCMESVLSFSGSSDIPIRRINLCCNRVMDEAYEQYDLFLDPVKLNKERDIQKAMLEIKERFGKNAVLKGMNLLEAGTTIARNGQIGGHKSG
jgi:hypothetical protein